MGFIKSNVRSNFKQHGCLVCVFLQLGDIDWVKTNGGPGKECYTVHLKK